ncbi:MAG: nucleotidyl transferase AbiEii/AbiGii toxin family protein [Candidatus Rokuibacteriota bacterium]
MRIDSPDEIVVNKLCAIPGRSELRDLVDLFFLERAGYPPLAALDRARRKDTGLTPGLLAWAISQVPLDRLPDGLLVPVSLEQLREFRARIVEALERLSFPADRGRI